VKVTLTDGKIAFDVTGPNAAQVKAVEAQAAD
jgi:ATP-dependent Clp protease ATP-binding subunit ClpA